MTASTLAEFPGTLSAKSKVFFHIILYSIIYVDTEYGIHGDAGMLILFYTTFQR